MRVSVREPQVNTRKYELHNLTTLVGCVQYTNYVRSIIISLSFIYNYSPPNLLGSFSFRRYIDVLSTSEPIFTRDV